MSDGATLSTRHIAYLTPGEMVIPRAMLTTQFMQIISTEAERRGIDPRRLVVGKGSINPATGEEQFNIFGDALDRFKDMTGMNSPSQKNRDRDVVVPRVTELPVQMSDDDLIKSVSDNVEPKFRAPNYACPVDTYVPPFGVGVFGPRKNPVDGTREVHRGADLANSMGGPVRAIEDGTIISVAPGKGANQLFTQGSVTGNIYGNAHTVIADGLKVGDSVRASQQIGQTDKSGRSTKPHVHTALIPGSFGEPAGINDPRVDPVPFLNSICANNRRRPNG